uniref:G-protein coupled receptors family 1 profile domain-containing protein n=1 Tax=Cercocebus atys TaxID=9531 RepID=A0A2K5LYP8_CERAT
MRGNSHNSSGFPHFILTGLPGLETSQHWSFLLLGALYIVSIVGNARILFIIKKECSLHQPMYYFLSLLSANDLGVSFPTLPTVLSGILLAMSFDRYVAICIPLRYATVLTDAHVVHMGMSITIRSFCMVFPLPFLLKRLPFCKANVLSHAYCLHPNLICQPCGDITINCMYGLFIVIFTFGLDSALILLSYVLILCSVLAIASREERLKTLNTCVSHMCAALIFYVPMVCVSIAARYGRHAPWYVHTLMSLIYLFVPLMLNPVIYSIKTKQIRQRLCKILLVTRI